MVGAGGLYFEYDGRDVPDMATVVADYNEGCQFIVSATMMNDVQLGEVIRGHLATIKFSGVGKQDGPNIPVVAGTYRVTLNSATGASYRQRADTEVARIRSRVSLSVVY